MEAIATRPQDSGLVLHLIRVGKACAWFLASTPLVFLWTQLLQALVYRDNPEGVIFDVLDYGLLLPAMSALSFGAPLWVAGAIVLGFARVAPWRAIAVQGLVLLTGIGALVLFWGLAPTGYLEWLLD